MTSLKDTLQISLTSRYYGWKKLCAFRTLAHLLKKRKKAVAVEAPAETLEEPPVPEAPKVQDNTRDSEPAAAVQESQGEEVAAPAASIPALESSPGCTSEENRKEATCLSYPSGKQMADQESPLTDRTGGEEGSEVMAAQPIVLAADGASGGNSPGIVSAPENGAARTQTSEGGFKNVLLRRLRIQKKTSLPRLYRPYGRKLHPVLLL